MLCPAFSAQGDGIREGHGIRVLLNVLMLEQGGIRAGFGLLKSQDAAQDPGVQPWHSCLPFAALPVGSDSWADEKRDLIHQETKFHFSPSVENEH